MLELLGSGLISLWLEMAGVQIKPAEALEALTWQNSPGLVLAPDPNPTGTTTVKKYLQALTSSQLVTENLTNSQGIWMQSGPILMANHQGTTPLPAASLTKIATSLVALKTWGPNHQFETLVSATGPIVNGVLQGDLVIIGGGDPLFVWEEAITLGNTLNKIGIKQVKGNLLITSNFAMNFEQNPILAGQMLKQALNRSSWTRPANYTHSIMAKGTAKPQIVIAGSVKLAPQLNPQATLLVRHRSLTLQQLIKEMNVFSNNVMAEMLAESAGGAGVVQSKATTLAGVPEAEIKLINGSGLGVDNRISPRAACAMLMAIQREAVAHKINVADLFPTFGFDRRGTLQGRKMPDATVMKTGTLREVSALAGVIPTGHRGLVWFAIINRGPQISGFRASQDQLLQALVKQLDVAPNIPPTITPKSPKYFSPELGSATRNEILLGVNNNNS
ncbi:Peptidase S13, D-Ala-D-Ala carboxypeptidase C [Umezakia ovalisporum]|uniref:D-alanyl-D-alanine carboxypeptidase n=1 Tax=Umezakia ovalisporum FSS-62 TaxID=2971776 RepID=A0AA43GXA2_9CYAN|nr:D-alanyl-D-alanine carboxypeptidase [Umezakia ovalisporum]MBI1241039.1 D-alanyl-D-alanine carboxypeptidase [Nostoc sp. RI_552]MDH6063160.1 D-alanyl-D-alanine carboxypeptidase [Umezakia ovalisporum FSS-62]MDH6079703.1 D-alanyl-D-alanine carboxypeptidase [Umezakia ovalisporum FSS-45]MDH6102712.1 D-alanyl-D-alanine carboxypeptidase [Umezakia ovalisporum ANA283AFssAo]CEJ45176.1 Peptidase S13, D-Ala-D-Ala carboxypeptidase C [Umezakia ovalisporum]